MRYLKQPLLYLRFLRYILWEFRWSLLIFWGMVFLGGLLFQACYHPADGKPLGFLEASFAIFTLVFMQPGLPFPKEEWYLQPLFFIVPIIGLGAMADSLVRLGYLVFAQKSNSREWHLMVASLYRKHIILVGIGKVGLSILKGLIALREPVVIVDENPSAEFEEEVRILGVPLIKGNGRHRAILEQAGVERARAIILVTDDDLANVDAALTAREANEDVHVVLRLFDETLATRFASRFAMPAISIAQEAAPAFVAAATGHKVYHSFQLGGKQLHITDLTICLQGSIAGRTVGDVQEQHAVNIVMHREASGVAVNPEHDAQLEPNDTVLVIAPMERLIELGAANQPE